MKDPKDFTLVGLVLRMVALKLQEQVIKARRKCLRAELMSRLPEDVPQMIAGWRVRRHWCNETFRSARVEAGRWTISIRKPERGKKESSL
jgi:hypothetical protein